MSLEEENTRLREDLDKAKAERLRGIEESIGTLYRKLDELPDRVQERVAENIRPLDERLTQVEKNQRSTVLAAFGAMWAALVSVIAFITNYVLNKVGGP